jgi:hypothetical protein
MERGLSILWIDAICGSVQNSMTPPEKPAPVEFRPNRLRTGRLTVLKNRLKTGGSLLDEYGIIQGVEAREFLDGAGAPRRLLDYRQKPRGPPGCLTVVLGLPG